MRILVERLCPRRITRHPCSFVCQALLADVSVDVSVDRVNLMVLPAKDTHRPHRALATRQFGPFDRTHVKQLVHLSQHAQRVLRHRHRRKILACPVPRVRVRHGLRVGARRLVFCLLLTTRRGRRRRGTSSLGATSDRHQFVHPRFSSGLLSEQRAPDNEGSTTRKPIVLGRSSVTNRVDEDLLELLVLEVSLFVLEKHHEQDDVRPCLEVRVCDNTVVRTKNTRKVVDVLLDDGSPDQVLAVNTVRHHVRLDVKDVLDHAISIRPVDCGGRQQGETHVEHLTLDGLAKGVAPLHDLDLRHDLELVVVAEDDMPLHAQDPPRHDVDPDTSTLAVLGVNATLGNDVPVAQAPRQVHSREIDLSIRLEDLDRSVASDHRLVFVSCTSYHSVADEAREKNHEPPETRREHGLDHHRSCSVLDHPSMPLGIRVVHWAVRRRVSLFDCDIMLRTSLEQRVRRENTVTVADDGNRSGVPGPSSRLNDRLEKLVERLPLRLHQLDERVSRVSIHN
mmetsp:Transcript_9686/g.18809  ORF Transcript_9686/g.18809 Transcript_9686/m.18809 type:complete len:508 (-) Transcript_9686:1479-3002(-)